MRHKWETGFGTDGSFRLLLPLLRHRRQLARPRRLLLRQDHQLYAQELRARHGRSRHEGGAHKGRAAGRQAGWQISFKLIQGYQIENEPHSILAVTIL